MVLLSVSSVMNTVLAVLLAILILLAMITVHEFGHYVAGKILKFKINEFAIGFGPKLFRRVSRKSGEAFSIRLLPLGGFCAFEGEDGEAENENAFNAKAPWKRIIVLVAGPLMNYILAVQDKRRRARGRNVFGIQPVRRRPDNLRQRQGNIPYHRFDVRP